MIVNLVDVFLHLARQCGRHLPLASLASQMCCVGVELAFEINQNRPARCELLIGNGLLKFGISLVDLGVERGGIETFAGYSKLIDKREFKISEAFNLRVASGLGKSCSAATGDGNCRDAKEQVNEILSSIRVHKGRGR
jgi:hypothetical protein